MNEQELLDSVLLSGTEDPQTGERSDKSVDELIAEAELAAGGEASADAPADAPFSQPEASLPEEPKGRPTPSPEEERAFAAEQGPSAFQSGRKKTGKKARRKRERWKDYLARVDTPVLRAFRRISTALFILLYAALIVALVMIGTRFLSYCRESFQLYEAGQIGYALDATMERLNAATPAELKTLLPAEEPAATEFEDASAILDERYEALSQAVLTAVEKRGMTSDGHTYLLLADGQQAGSFILRSEPVEEKLRLGLLRIERWKYDGGSADFSYPSRSLLIDAPEGFRIEVNGVTLDGRWRTDEEELDRVFRYVDEYAHMPRMLHYRIDGLICEPGVRVYDNLGNPLDVQPDGAGRLSLPYAWKPVVPTAEQEEQAVQIAQLWSNYTLRDAELGEILPVLIPDSNLYQYVRDSNHERRYIDRHTLLGYENISVSEYTVYTEDCVSFRVTMDRTVVVDARGTPVTDRVDNVFFLVRMDPDGAGPRWLIADMHAAG